MTNEGLLSGGLGIGYWGFFSHYDLGISHLALSRVMKLRPPQYYRAVERATDGSAKRSL